ncbi:MAG: AtpZ/AtpI family protein [Pseudomonadota bacterium]
MKFNHGCEIPSHQFPAMTDQKSPRPPSLDELDQKIERGRDAAGLKPAERPAVAGAMGRGFHVAIEFVVATLMGTFLGYIIGDALGQKVIGLVLGIIIGFGAGLRRLHALMQAEAKALESRERAKHGRDDDGDA